MKRNGRNWHIYFAIDHGLAEEYIFPTAIAWIAE